MSKLIVALAAAAGAAAHAAQVSSVVPEYLPLVNPGEELCLARGEFKNETKTPTYFKLELAACDDTDVDLALFKFAGDGKELRTDDDYCVDTLTKSGKAGVELVLRECPEKIKDKGLKWTQVGVDQWENGYELCMQYNNETAIIEQSECATLADDDVESPQQFVLVEPPMVKCMDWGKNWLCGRGFALNDAKGLTCVGATGAECANICCAPAKTCQSEGYIKCPVNYKFVNRECNNYGQANCNWDVCCEPETTCKSAGFANQCPIDYTFVDRKCGNPGQPACTWDLCCKYDPVPIKCNTWNMCSRNWELKPRAKDIWCTRGKPVEGPNYAPTCSDDICCDKTVEQSTCGRWNSCDAGFEVKPNSYNKRCYVKVPVDGVMPLHHGGGSSNEWCSNNYCCAQKVDPQPPTPSPSTCAASFKCDASQGRVPKPNAETLQCYPAAPGSLNPRCSDQFCCEQDTCKNWSQRVVEEKIGPFNTMVELTGEDVCRDDPAKYSGLMDKNDSRFTQPCMENGRQVECKPELCCIQNVMPLL